jgi:hypothetical protein
VEPRQVLHADRRDERGAPHEPAVLASVRVVNFGRELAHVEVARVAHGAVQDHRDGLLGKLDRGHRVTEDRLHLMVAASSHLKL